MIPHTIADVLVEAATGPRSIRAVEHDGRVREMTHAWLLEESLRIAGALRSRGLRPGDRVAVVVPEVNGFIRAFFGVAAAGLIPVPLCPPAQAGDVPTFTRQTRYLLAASRASAVIASADVAPLLDMRDMRGKDGAVGLSTCQVLTIEALTDGPAVSAPLPAASYAPALIQFTSGSTAMPKGVMLSHAGLSANLSAIVGPAGLAVGPSDVCISWLPLHHDMGLIGAMLASVFAKIDAVIMSPTLFLKRPTAWLDAISHYRGTISFAPNFAYDLCLRRVKPGQIASLDLSSWRVAGCGAEPVRCDTLEAFADRFAVAGFRSASFLPAYGLAEHSLAVAFAVGGITVDSVDPGRLVRDSRAVPVDDDGTGHAVRLVGCGRAFPEHELRILAEDGRPLPERHVGRIVVRGPSVMMGYFEDVPATREALHDGWLQTGDLGYITGGELFVCGRTKDLIIRHGRKYHPPDIEMAIASVEGMRPSGIVVFGMNKLGEADEVVAVLEARPSNTPRDIEDQVRRRVRETAGLELDRVVLTPPGTIPRTTSGKVRRSETRARFRAGTLLTGGRTVPELQAHPLTDGSLR